MFRPTSSRSLTLAICVLSSFIVLMGCSKAGDSPLPDNPGTGGGGSPDGGIGGSGIVIRDAGSDAPADSGCVTEDGSACRYAVEDAGPSCGDGIISAEISEVCDDGNALAGDGCAGTCKFVEPNFMCPAGGGACVPTVGCGVVDPATGVAKRDPGEECDDGNGTDGDGCSAACKMEPGWFCSNVTGVCQKNQNCGDGKVQQGEECDFGAVAVEGCDQTLCVYEPGWVCGATACQPVQECGDGRVNGSEQCDDGNETSGDGCSGTSCMIEASWFDCPSTGGVCNDTARCGNGVLEKTELCDDLNVNPGDGCSASCQVEPGFQCRQAGKACVPDCGDGLLTGSESCDDANEVSGDGCSSTCLAEPGFTCAGTPSVCTGSICGNSVREGNEACDLGPNNGLFYGDGQGCSKTCTQEPTCRTSAGVTQACSTACGDGNRDAGEGCDDGNKVSGDGCSASCQAESGFTCTDEELLDTEPCVGGPGECLLLPVIFRDFEGQQVTGGHPDFFYLGATVGAARTLCVPNAASLTAPAAATGNCSDTDATERCTGLVQTTLNAQGKPQFNATKNGMCACRFTDWDSQTLITAATTGATACTVTGNGSTRYRVGYGATPLMVKTIQSATTFGQWYTDSSYSTAVRGTLELAAVGGGLYQFSSSAGQTVYDDIHDICLAPTRTGTLDSGFFPLEGQPRATVCNIWPYWTTGLQTNCCAGAGCPVVSQWDPLAAYDGCPRVGTGGPVPSSGGTGGKVNGMLRNFYFTTEARYLFRYTTAGTLSFFGDDDVWVFVNGRLALDLGATHERLEGSVAINAATFGLEVGKIYEIAVFHADRHPRESNYQLTLSGFTTLRSNCTPRCGDGETTAGEECDNGAANSDTAYDGCTTECKLGPFCGDGQTDAPNEECDDGRNVTVGGDVSGCAPGCKLPPACGNARLDPGEECDLGAANSDSSYGSDTCTTTCVLGPYCGDGRQNGSEQCDNRLNQGQEYNQCADGCLWGPRCGDGVFQAEYEQCDDGAANGQPGMCSETCGAEAKCGDAIKQDSEECDLGTAQNTGEYGGCTAACVFAPYCGDGVVQSDQGEACDYAGQNQPAEAALYGSCLTSCQLGPHCGDGQEQSPDEQCDDGNNESQDGCAKNCRDEVAIR